MSTHNRKVKQLNALELILAMTNTIHSMEKQETRFSYQDTNKHERNKRVIIELCGRLGLQPQVVEDEIQRLAARLMGEPTLTVPNREIPLANGIWKPTEFNGRKLN